MINRRSILKMLGLAPVVAPIAALAAMEAPAHGTGVMAEGCEFVSITGITCAADKMVFYNGTTPSAWGVALIDDAAASVSMRTLGLSPLPAALPFHAHQMVG